MKKIAKLFILSLLLLMTSCEKDSTNKIDILCGDYTTTDFIELNNNDALDALRDSNSDFIVYGYLPGCLTCSSFEPKLKSYIDSYGLSIYKINFSKLNKGDPLKVSSGAPVIGFYKSGKALNITSYADSTKNIFEDDKDFKAFFEKYVSLPSNFYISPETLDKKIQSKDSFVVLYSRSSCSDCSSLFNNYLNEYMKNNKNKTFYIIECDTPGIRLDENYEFAQEQWQNFKDDYKLSSTTSEFGYLTGVVPTFQYYKNGVLSDSNVYVNDSYEYKFVSASAGKNGEQIRNYEITITNSFIESLKNKVYTYSATYTNDENEAKNIRNYMSQELVKVHNQYLDNFLKQYLGA